MSEQFAEVGRGITLCYEASGPVEGPPVLLVPGLGMQLNSWPVGFCAELADRGMRVVRFDNRDTGRSTHLRYRPPSMWRLLRRDVPPEAYDLGDMAGDVAGLIEALGLDRAHVVGASMGGMIAQMTAARYPHRVLTLTSIMSTTGGRFVGNPSPRMIRRLFLAPPRTREEAVERSLETFRHIGSHGFAFDEAAHRAMIGEAWDRDPSRAGVGRQLAAIMASGDRGPDLARITAPTLVVHGDRDRMVHPSGGRATRRAVPGARFVSVKGMGHDLPAGVWPILADLITEHTGARVAGASGTDTL